MRFYQQSQHGDAPADGGGATSKGYSIASNQAMGRGVSTDALLLSKRLTSDTSPPAANDSTSTSWRVPYKPLVYFVIAFSIACSAIALILLHRYKKERVFRAASRTFMNIIIGGSFSIWASLILVTAFPVPSAMTCYAIYITRYAGFATVFGALTVKTWRVVQFSKVNISMLSRMSDHNLLRGLFYFIALWFVAVMVPLVLPNAHTRPLVVFKTDVETLETFPFCDVGSLETYWGTLEAISLLAGLFVTIQCRNIPTSYNEGFWMSSATYNWAMSWISSRIGRMLIDSTQSPSLRLFLLVGEWVGSVLPAILMLFVPKVVMVFRVRICKTPTPGG
ncbi:7 transmembrane sweet-taste receptor of 3 GCPR-domain-containing protein [Entophlyctis helioformis]|nr:7 transmembrane sweet-taste receptor of 3 GCPR-domain-containing protein [Entophlyctis helioformis]